MGRVLDERNPEFDEIYRSTGDNRRIEGDVALLKQEWAKLSNISAALSDTYKSMHRDAHCHESVMWFAHHLSQPARQRVAKSTPVPLLPSKAHSCPGTASAHEKVVCDAYTKRVSCNQCHGEPKAIVV